MQIYTRKSTEEGLDQELARILMVMDAPHFVLQRFGLSASATCQEQA